jgi:hypothetical protein
VAFGLVLASAQLRLCVRQQEPGGLPAERTPRGKPPGLARRGEVATTVQFRWAVWLRLRSAVHERARQAAYSRQGTHGAPIDLDVPLSPPFNTKATDSRTHAKQPDGLLDSDTFTRQYSQTRVPRRAERRRLPK